MMNTPVDSGTSGVPNAPGPNLVTGEPQQLKIIKTQLIPHPISLQASHNHHPHSQHHHQQQPMQLQSQQHMPSPSSSAANTTPPLSSALHSPSNLITTITPTQTHKHPNNPTSHLLGGPNNSSAPLQLTKGTNLISLNPVAAKITHVKTATIDGNASGSSIGTTGSASLQTTISSISSANIGNLASAGGSAIKIASGASPSSNSLTLSNAQSTTATAIRAIGAGGQSTQVRVVMSTGIVSPSMIKQFEGASAPGRTQITAIPTATARSGTNTSITMARPISQTYLPRASVTATAMPGMGMATQRLMAPIRTSSVGTVSGGATVTGLAAPGNFVRGTAVSRNNSTPPWTTGQVQLIRTIAQPRQRIITAQGISNAVGTSVTSTTSVTGSSMAQTGQATITGVQQTQSATSGATIQAVSQTTCHNQQPTFVATVLPPRQHQATLVYSSNVATSTPLSQPQQFNSTVATAQRFAVATALSSTTASSGTARQIRPILSKSFSTAKLNTTSISIRTPNIPHLASNLPANNSAASSGSMASGLTATTVSAGSTVCGPTSLPRASTVAGSTTNNVISTTNLPTTRIIQLQQQPGNTAQQILSSTGRLAGNVMLPPIIVNASATGKLVRPPVTMAAKVQSSLTITQLGINKIPGAGNASSATGQQGLTASIQAINPGNVLGNSGTGGVTTSASNTNSSSMSVGTSITPPQLTTGSQLLAAQNIVSSSGSATVVPLAITAARGGACGNILTGTITPIKSAGAITVGKVMAQTQLASDTGGSLNNNGNVFIHHTGNVTSSKAHSVGNVAVTVTSNAGSSTTSATNSILTSVASSSGGSTFLPHGAIYYESMPAGSVQVSTGILSLTTTTVTNSTIAQNQIISSASLSSLPFVSHGPNSTTTFTVVPSTGGRTIGQLQLPISSTGAQIQAVPVRCFSTHGASNLTVSGSGGTNEAITITQAASQTMQGTITGNVAGGQQILIPTSHPSGLNAGGQSQQHMVIPLQTSIKVTSNSNASSLVSNFIRKRDGEGCSTIRAAKNLAPTLFSMGSNILTVSGTSSASVSTSSPFSIVSAIPASAAALTTEAMAKKDRTPGGAIVTLSRAKRTESPISTDGSTTVSANSSPGVDQQMLDSNLVINRDTAHFSPILELYANHHQSVGVHQNVMDVQTGSRSSLLEHRQNTSTSIHRINNGLFECPPRKKTRRSTNDSIQSNQSQVSLSLPPPNIVGVNPPSISTENNIPTVTEINSVGTPTNTTGNKENAKPIEYILRRPPNCTLLSSYMQNWKPANNHFQRYTDVKPREERRPTVIDLANQTNILGKINGWKLVHLRSTMEDLCENESLGYEKLSEMLKQMESHDKTSDSERISELLKGNMQRSKIIVDGINEAQNQIMRIFEHKSNVSDIVIRCASKRNFKKREKV